MTINRLAAHLAVKNTVPRAWVLAMVVCAWLSGCNRKSPEPPPPEELKSLSLHVGEEFKDAYARSVDFGATDWTDKCSYQYGYDVSPDPQYRYNARYFDLSQRMQFHLVRRSKTRIILDSPEWKSLADGDCILSSIGINNSRMLRFFKSEMVYFVSELKQTSDGTTTLSGFIGGADSQFLYTGMTEELARKHIALSGNTEVPITNEETRVFIAKVNEMRVHRGWPKQVELTDAPSWISVRLPNQSVLHIQFTIKHAPTLIETMIYENPKGNPSSDSNLIDPNLRFFELQLINLVKPVLTHWQADESNASGEANSNNNSETDQNTPDEHYR